tara:strand:- start:218 stop:391 length:174 start_codon:yes stop_codon:yes gene_type:complete
MHVDLAPRSIGEFARHHISKHDKTIANELSFLLGSDGCRHFDLQFWVKSRNTESLAD